MLTEDYLMRMISQAIAALMIAIGFRKAGQLQQARQTIYLAIEGLTGIRPEILDRLDNQALVDSLTMHGQIDQERALLLADLLLEQGRLDDQQGQPANAAESYQRSLFLYLECTAQPPESSVHALQTKILELTTLLPDELPFDLNFALFNYFETRGDYKKAEQILQRMLNSKEYLAELKQEQQEFYQRLREKSDLDLLNGGLIEEEIQRLRL